MPRVPTQRRRAVQAAASSPEGTRTLGGRQLTGSLTLRHVDALSALAMFCQLDGTEYAAAGVRSIAEKLSDEIHGRAHAWTVAYAATVALNLRRHARYMDADAAAACAEVVERVAAIGGARVVDPVEWLGARGDVGPRVAWTPRRPAPRRED